jgi:hypothetical protein
MEESYQGEIYFRKMSDGSVDDENSEIRRTGTLDDFDSRRCDSPCPPSVSSRRSVPLGYCTLSLYVCVLGSAPSVRHFRRSSFLMWDTVECASVRHAVCPEIYRISGHHD